MQTLRIAQFHIAEVQVYDWTFLPVILLLFSCQSMKEFPTPLEDYLQP